MPEGFLEEEEETRLRAILDDGLARLRQVGLDATGLLRVWEEPNGAIGAFAREIDADLVVIGHHQRSAFSRWWRGSVSHSLLDQLSCSLLVSMHSDVVKQVATSDA